MKKLILRGSTLLLVSLLFISCNTRPNTDNDTKIAGYTLFQKSIPLKQVHQMIIEAGVADGWNMTEFEGNELIADKTENGITKVVNIYFSKESFKISPENSDLEDAIEKKFGL
jgi:predicted small secreted protein